MGCKSAERNLINVFVQDYRFECETLYMNLKKKWDSPESLLIFVYSGHAAVDKYWEMYLAGELGHGFLGLRSPWISWESIKSYIGSSKGGRGLCILDCCCDLAAQSHKGPEILAASGWHRTEKASANLHFSFTNVLARHLKSLNGKPHSVSQIFGDLTLARRRYKLQRSINHVGQVGKTSVILGRKLKKTDKYDTISQEDLTKAIERMSESGYRVLISALFVKQDVIPSREQFTSWLTANLPPDLRSLSITLESAKRTDSMLLLLTVPLLVWDGLPTNNTAYDLISFVEDPPKKKPSTEASGLTERENIPHRSGGSK
ncbi:hypothetical protein IWZ03DRAFT_410704 [Phyllosticta citriasiana]|uniref:Uncharacterized protein n=1 Tax=Phyllosticta citriasiana TaxID=595635 RepID=A0ABR1KYE5_9PEZI